MTAKLSVLLVGAGSMGGAMLRGWLRENLLETSASAVVDPQLSPELLSEVETAAIAVNPVDDIPYDICVLAVKPQLFPTVIPSLDWPEIDKTLFISVAAGQSTNTIGQHLKQVSSNAISVIRAMPNLPVSVGQGMTLLYSDQEVSKAHREAATALMQATGEAIWVETEELIDVGMSISACGPAYVFLLTEAMAEAGIAAGLPADLARKLALQTVSGSSMLMQSDTRRPDELREAVTSKGGTTAEALRVLDSENGFRPLLKRAISAATQRAKELSD